MNQEQSTGFHDELSDIKFVEDVELKNAKPIDFIAMARLSLSYLSNNPLKDNGYECRFSLAPLNCPPLTPDEGWMTDKIKSQYIDPISVGDTESRNDMAFNMMRAMTGNYVTGIDAQKAVHKRLINSINKDGKYNNICWHHPFCMNNPSELTWASLWATGMLLQSECDLFRADPINNTLVVAKMLFEGIMNCSIRENGRAYHKAGMSFFNNEDEKINEYAGHYPLVMGPLCEYWSVSKDKRCWEFLYEVAEGFVLDMIPDIKHLPNGGVEGHNHCQLHALRGMAQFAYLSKEPRYLEWIKKVYDYYYKYTLDSGWLPEIRSMADHSNHTETCLNSDMLEMEIWLALSGCVELWDRIDRSIRNYFVPCQFTVTKEFEKIYKIVNSDKNSEDVENGIKTLRELEGGFISAITPNDRVFPVGIGREHWGKVKYQNKSIVYDMMGCCPPEGMRAIYYVWKYATTQENNSIFIHLPYNIDSELASVTSKLPEKGEISVRAKIAGKYFIKVPQWVPRDRVKATINQEEVDFKWGHTSTAYCSFQDVVPGDLLKISYPLIDMWQNVEIKPVEQEVENYKYHWIGNSIVEALPKGEYLPLYEDSIY